MTEVTMDELEAIRDMHQTRLAHIDRVLKAARDAEQPVPLYERRLVQEGSEALRDAEQLRQDLREIGDLLGVHDPGRSAFDFALKVKAAAAAARHGADITWDQYILDTASAVFADKDHPTAKWRLKKGESLADLAGWLARYEDQQTEANGNAPG